MLSTANIAAFVLSLEFSMQTLYPRHAGVSTDAPATARPVGRTGWITAVLLACCHTLFAQVTAVPVYLISTVAGNGPTFSYSGDGGAATSASLYYPQSVALDGAGNLYLADASNNRIRMVSAATGVISTVAGGGTGCAAQTDAVGDGCAATSAVLKGPAGVTLDSAGDIYIADFSDERVRMVNASTGIISTVAGTGYVKITGDGDYNGDGIAATSAELNGPVTVALDSSNNIYIADATNNRIRMVSATTGLISTLAGTGTTGYNGDGRLATTAKLYGASGVAVDSAGNVYIADTFNSRIRKISVGTALISTVAGNGTPGYTDGVAAASAELNYPYGVLVDSAGDLYITDTFNAMVREVNASNGIINTLAGDGTQGYNADGIAATSAELNYPYGVALDAVGDVYIADVYNDRVRMLSTTAQFPPTAVGASANQTFTFDVNAGTTIGAISVVTQGATGLDFNAQMADSSLTLCGTQTYSSATTCTVDVTFTPKVPGTRMGAIVITDGGGNVLATEYIAGMGTGPQAVFLPGVQSTVVSGYHYAVAVDASGNVYTVDASSSYGSVLKETLSGGSYTQSTIGSGLFMAEGVAVDGAGNVYIADFGHERVLKETLSAGVYTQSTIASYTQANGVAVDGNGNIYVTQPDDLLLLTPSGSSYTQRQIISNLIGGTDAAVDGSGNVYVTDSQNSRVVKGTLSGGSYTQSDVGSGLSEPYAVAVDGNGNVYIADTNNNKRVLKETLSSGSYTQSVVLSSGLSFPEGIAIDGNGNIYIEDAGATSRVLKLDVADAPSLSFDTTAVGGTSLDSPQTVTALNNGNTSLSFPIPFIGVDPSISANFSWNATGGTACPTVDSGASSAGALAAGATCTLPISFSPAVPGITSGALVLTDNQLNATNATQTIVLNGTGTQQDAQTINFTAPATPVTYGFTPITLVATATSGLPVSFSVVSGSANVSGNTLTINGAGPVVVAANQAGNVNYAAAPQATQSVVVFKALLGVMATSPTITYGQAVPAYTASILGFVNGDTSAVVSGSPALTTVPATPSSAGTYTITTALGTLAAANYSFAFVNGTLTINQATQAIIFAQPASPVVYGVGPITLTATGGSSGNAVVFSVISGSGSISGATLTITEGGTVVVAANQAGNSNYAAAAQVTRSIVVNPAAQIITFPNPGSQLYGVPPITLTATASTGLPITYSVTRGPATVNGSTLTLTGAGAVTVQAAQLGNANYAAATASVSFVVVAPDFSVAISPGALSIPQGGEQGSTGSATVTLTPIGGFTAPIQLSCVGLPSNAGCKFSPATITLNGAAASSTLTIATNVQSASISAKPGKIWFALLIFPAGLFVWRRRIMGAGGRRWAQLLTIFIMLAAGVCMTGCGWGGVRPPWWSVTPTGTTSVLVTASTIASGGPSHSTAFVLTVTN
jgi:sugar lactone lactonase YvrE